MYNKPAYVGLSNDNTWIGAGYTTHKRIEGQIENNRVICSNPHYFLMLGLPSQSAVRYIGTFQATGESVSSWAALDALMANDVVGQWKLATTAAAVAACNGLLAAWPEVILCDKTRHRGIRLLCGCLLDESLTVKSRS